MALAFGFVVFQSIDPCLQHMLAGEARGGPATAVHGENFLRFVVVKQKKRVAPDARWTRLRDGKGLHICLAVLAQAGQTGKLWD